MYVQLLQPKIIELSGVPRKFYPGQVVEVGKQSALLWISCNEARPLEASDYRGFIPGESGIVTDRKDLLCKAIQDMQVTIFEGACTIQFDRTVWIDSLLSVRPELLAIGLGMLDTWDIAVPLQDYKILAANVGSEAEREKTKAVIRDLRVPLYDTRLMFIRKTPEMTSLIELWRTEGLTDLAFLRAVYKVKPFILALPTTWTHGRAPASV